jgi:hypothetical protein
MKRLFLLSIILPYFASCQQLTEATSSGKSFDENANHHPAINHFATIADIPVPAGYERAEVPGNSFAKFLRTLPLKKNTTVYLYNGQPKINQDAQFAIIDISTGNRDLQQCADAIMRLRAEYLYVNSKNEQIQFTDNANVVYAFKRAGNRTEFDTYLEKVFSRCGTLSLEKQLQRRSSMNDVNIGDVLIKGGSPGHAMLVVDMAFNKEGKKIIMLSQSYMPAQDIHVVKNQKYPSISPWYVVDNESDIITPEWTFHPNQLRHW